MSETSKTLQLFNQTFVALGIVTDQCEFEGEKPCQVNQVPPKGTAVRGLSYYAAITTNDTDKKWIQNLLKESTNSMINTCDSNMNCGTLWAAGVPHDETLNFHTQETSFEVINGYFQSLNDSFLTRYVNSVNISINAVVPGVANISNSTRPNPVTKPPRSFNKKNKAAPFNSRIEIYIAVLIGAVIF